ncbi:MAG: tRNA uridine-5-carboxymethylaminomethyl(34) synthesis GTPase MnmE [Bacteroidia bacterium]|nr:tRNA uridine-5-carboxymethylaminomethyl(34) synthesis GTPase MnmE [Bacteroidia bacterium]
MIQLDTTICAISTAPGVGGIAVIRVSGKQAICLSDKIFKAKKSLLEQGSDMAAFGRIVDAEAKVIDEVIVTVFRAPNSFTGEDVVEISCHGSLYVQQEIVRLLLAQGCVMAGPGEFTQRAFLNGKMDLSQAEAVADLIASTSAAAHRVAINQMRGGFSSELALLREKLLEFTALIELELDFVEEDVVFADRSRLKLLSQEIDAKIDSLSKSFSAGNAIKNGVSVAIVGETNAGKSTLLNVLLNEERAIVSDIHGTTRDLVEDTTVLSGIMFRFIDTAGIRQTDDDIEKLGIKRSYKAIEQASIVIWMIDATQVNEHIDWMAERIIPRTQGKKLLLVFNKVDKVSESEKCVLEDLFSNVQAQSIFISAKYKENIAELINLIVESSHMPEISSEDVIVTNLRHYEALCKALEAIRRVQDGLDSKLSGDLLSLDLHDCLDALGSIVGEISSEEVLHSIFKNFCIGK